MTINITEPPYTDPYVRWCGRRLVVRSAPIPILNIIGVFPAALRLAGLQRRAVCNPAKRSAAGRYMTAFDNNWSEFNYRI